LTAADKGFQRSACGVLFTREEAMAEAKRLRMGVEGPSPTPGEEAERIEVLRATVTKYLPEFARGMPRSWRREIRKLR
jgi:hypothetical protein